jgi:NSS family neurotransmitter:Na+ symporter
MTIPAVFTSMPGGVVFMTVFFVLTAVASVGAILSLLEVPVAILSERYGLNRKLAALATIGAIALLGVPAALSQSLTADLKLFGLNPFDLFDFVSSNLLLPIGGILICLFVGWVYGLAAPERRLAETGSPLMRLTIRTTVVLVRYVAPLAIAIVLLHGLNVF